MWGRVDIHASWTLTVHDTTDAQVTRMAANNFCKNLFPADAHSPHSVGSPFWLETMQALGFGSLYGKV